MTKITLKWTKQELETLLTRRLDQAGADVFDNLCDAYEVEPGAALINHAIDADGEGVPAYLFQLGSELIGRIADHPTTPAITDDDLRAVLF